MRLGNPHIVHILWKNELQDGDDPAGPAWYLWSDGIRTPVYTTRHEHAWVRRSSLEATAYEVVEV